MEISFTAYSGITYTLKEFSGDVELAISEEEKRVQKESKGKKKSKDELLLFDKYLRMLKHVVSGISGYSGEITDKVFSRIPANDMSHILYEVRKNMTAIDEDGNLIEDPILRLYDRNKTEYKVPLSECIKITEGTIKDKKGKEKPLKFEGLDDFEDNQFQRFHVPVLKATFIFKLFSVADTRQILAMEQANPLSVFYKRDMKVIMDNDKEKKERQLAEKFNLKSMNKGILDHLQKRMFIIGGDVEMNYYSSTGMIPLLTSPDFF